eukprot:1376861-Pyramimonas_sp.AAC.1
MYESRCRLVTVVVLALLPIVWGEEGKGGMSPQKNNDNPSCDGGLQVKPIVVQYAKKRNASLAEVSSKRPLRSTIVIRKKHVAYCRLLVRYASATRAVQSAHTKQRPPSCKSSGVPSELGSWCEYRASFYGRLARRRTCGKTSDQARQLSRVDERWVMSEVRCLFNTSTDFGF